MNHRSSGIPAHRALAVAVLTLALSRFASASPAEFKAGVFDPPRAAPDFALQGSDGHALMLSHFRGKIVLLAFGYSSCAAVCPVTLATLAQARRKLGAAAADVQVVYVTVDPERDVPQRLNRFLGAFDKTFVGGTGSEAQLAAVRKDYGVTATKIPFGNDYSYDHSSFIYLIDRAGRIRALMPFGHSSGDFVHDLKILLKN